MSEALASSSAHPLSESRTGPSILRCGEVLTDCFPDREVEGAPPSTSPANCAGSGAAWTSCRCGRTSSATTRQGVADGVGNGPRPRAVQFAVRQSRRPLSIAAADPGRRVGGGARRPAGRADRKLFMAGRGALCPGPVHPRADDLRGGLSGQQPAGGTSERGDGRVRFGDAGGRPRRLSASAVALAPCLRQRCRAADPGDAGGCALAARRQGTPPPSRRCARVPVAAGFLGRTATVDRRFRRVLGLFGDLQFPAVLPERTADLGVDHPDHVALYGVPDRRGHGAAVGASGRPDRQRPHAGGRVAAVRGGAGRPAGAEPARAGRRLARPVPGSSIPTLRHRAR